MEEGMKRARVISALIAVFITIPIWFFLMYKVLQAINAGELMWFLYWVYVPFSVVVNIITHMTANSDK
jgi:hypothetical protein